MTTPTPAGTDQPPPHQSAPSLPSLPSPSSPTPYTIGKRYLNAKTHFPLTLRSIGELPGGGAQLWLGVEYDDPAHGRGHSGEYRGVQVFRSVQAGAGAFVKYTPGGRPLVEGVSLVAAVEERYGALVDKGREEPGKTESLADAVVLGSSNAAIIVEAPNMDDVRRRIGRLERLREIGFDGEWVSTLGRSEEERAAFKTRLKGVRILDLSRNLLAGWRDMAEIARHLESLTTLVLNHSRLGGLPPLSGDPEGYREAFGKIVELHLGDAALTWQEAVNIASVFPRLEVLYLNHNPLIRDPSYQADVGTQTPLPHLKTLSLDHCPLTSWDEIVRGLVGLRSLESLHLSDSPLKSIRPCPANAPRFTRLTHLVMSYTRCQAWTDVDNLATWTSDALQNLRISVRVATDDADEASKPSEHDPWAMSGEPNRDRPLLIAKLAALTMLNGTPVSRAERADAELYYIHYIDHLQHSHPGTASKWGRYDELVRKHGPGEKAAAPKATTLKSKMINLKIIPPNGHTFSLRMLPSATVSMLQKKVARQLKAPSVALFSARPIPEQMAMYEPVEEMDPGLDVGRWLSDGDVVLVVL